MYRPRLSTSYPGDCLPQWSLLQDAPNHEARALLRRVGVVQVQWLYKQTTCCINFALPVSWPRLAVVLPQESIENLSLSSIGFEDLSSPYEHWKKVNNCLERADRNCKSCMSLAVVLGSACEAYNAYVLRDNDTQEPSSPYHYDRA